MRRLSILFLAATILMPLEAWAQNFYIEVSGGLTQLDGNDPFFGTGTPNSGYGLSGTAAFMCNLGGGGPLEFHLGVEEFYDTASAGGNTLTWMPTYPLIRVQASIIFLGFGATPFSLVSGGANYPGGFQRGNLSLSWLGEAGVLWPVVPFFSLGVTASAQFSQTAGGTGPSPVLGLTALMRFYFWQFGSHSSNGSQSSSEFQGWRYPFGNEIH